MIFPVVAAIVHVTPYAVKVGANPSQALGSFDPVRALGAGVDAQNNGAVAQIYTPQNIQTMLTAGLGPVSYRLYTELSVQDWHWNPQGSWSDPAGQGYWTGALQSPMVQDSYGYRLPHRGFTHDQGNDDDYSRLDDGDQTTYWKSDPYLDQQFTGESDTLHAQWVVVDLGVRKAVDAIQLDWANPYATAYQVQYWVGDDAINDPGNGNWHTFPHGNVANGSGGNVTLPLASSPQNARFIRVLMAASSNTCDTHGSSDIRDCVGFALDELGVGKLVGSSTFHDYVVHKPNKHQTITYASSVDPWHAPKDRVRDEEQAGLDTVYTSGLTRGLPAMIPIGMLYGTPGDAAAELAYVEGRGYPVSYVEMGEEPDGQYVLPEDYGALYLQWATALHSVDPNLKLGGPVFQGTTSDVQTWPDANGNVSWLKRFLAYLTAHGRLPDLAFMSFEHYPFASCLKPNDVQKRLTLEPSLTQRVVQTWIADGLPHGTPMFITESNFSANTSYVFQDITGALWYADFAGSFLSAGGSAIYLYQYEPDPLFDYSGCPQGWGSWGMWDATGHYTIKAPTSEYFAAQMLTQTWAQPIDANQTLYPAITNVPGESAHALVTAYALNRPDGTWSLMLINKDPSKTYRVNVTFNEASGGKTHFASPVHQTTFSPAQYLWHSNGRNGYANPDGPANVQTVSGGPIATYLLPAYSLTVLNATLAQ